MSEDPDELRAENEAMHRNPPDVLERIEWRLMYGKYEVPGLYLVGGIIIALLALILWRIW